MLFAPTGTNQVIFTCDMISKRSEKIRTNSSVNSIFVREESC